MAEREAARRPPPGAEEIRRQLGWRLISSGQGDEDLLRLQFYLIPTTYAQLAAQIAFDWMLAPLCRPGRSLHTT